MSLKKFRRGETTYTCRCCKKNTRNVGGDEGQVQLCLDCYNLAGIENSVSDNGAEEAMSYYGNEARATFARRPELKPLFKSVADALDATAK